MSMGACLSILGLYNNDSSIFDLMSFPDGFTTEEKQTVKDNILVECAELECLYPAPDVMKNIIGIWSRKELPYWQRVYNAAQLEYNPIENYRRNETESIEDDRTEEHTGTDTTRNTGSDATARSGSDSLVKTGSDTVSASSESNEEAGGDDRTDNNITGYDSNTLVPQTEQEVYYGKTLDTTTEGEQTTTYGNINTTTYGSTDTTTYGKTESFQHGEKIEHGGTTERTVLAYGNIGVTTSQEMLTQEMEVAKIINVMNIIIESFKNRFCIMVY